MKYFPLTTDQTQVTGAYFDYGELIGMYSQDGKRLGTVNAENGEILIEKTYQKSLHLNVSFEKHYPVIKVMQNDKVLFDVTLSPEKIL